MKFKEKDCIQCSTDARSTLVCSPVSVPSNM